MVIDDARNTKEIEKQALGKSGLTDASSQDLTKFLDVTLPIYETFRQGNGYPNNIFMTKNETARAEPAPWSATS
jgi:hypothetical protein